MKVDWSDLIQDTLEELPNHNNLQEAADALQARWGLPISRSSLSAALLRAGYRASDFIGRNLHGSREASPTKTVVNPTSWDRPSGDGWDRSIGEVLAEHQEDPHLEVVRAVQSPRVKTLEDLCDALNQPPREVKRRVAAAQEAGHTIQVDGHMITFDRVQRPPSVMPVGIDAPTDTKPVVFAAISDTHFGHELCAVDELNQFIEYAYSLGVRHVLHAGDIFDGCYHRGHAFELKQVGFDRQCRAALDALPQIPGLDYYTITGNHDWNSYWKAIGMDPGTALQMRAEQAGRTDIHHLGNIQGRLLFGEGAGAMKVELVHPQKGGGSYAKSYSLQKWIELYEGGDKPHVAIMGHIHSYSVFEIRNVVAIQPGCWQWQTTFEQSKRLVPAVGGAIIWAWRDNDGFRFRHEWRRWWPKGVEWLPVG